MTAYALDGRETVLTADPRQEGSIRQRAKRFPVSRRFVGELLARVRRTGRDAPPPHGGGHPPRLEAQGRQVVYERGPSQPDATLHERCPLSAERGQVKPRRSSRQRTRVRLQRTRKQRLLRPPSVTVKRSKPNVASIKRRSVRWRHARGCSWRRRVSIPPWHGMMPERLKVSEGLPQNLATQGNTAPSWGRSRSRRSWRR
jgi:transposase